MLETDKQLHQRSAPIVPIALGILLMAALGGGWVFYNQAQVTTDGEPPLTQEARDYLPRLDLTGVEMSAAEDALGQTLLEITGKVANNGDRVVSLVEVNCVFRDVNDVEIDRQRAQVVRPRGGPLTPGETQDFRLPFDNISEAWNQAMPNLYIAQIQFEE